MSVKPQHKRLARRALGATVVDMTVGAEGKSFDISENAWTSAGETADPEGRDHMLVEIRASE
ncbi:MULTISPECIES: hypothetical protein [unclassified Streptomyces]|uniref:hypothetical protein n=1 Tax=unclassified Streptomyces TaxID=2593676 RepID=UPI000851A3B4|nr:MULTISPECIES: hypothetical protein [unclassified Streptomyces]